MRCNGCSKCAHFVAARGGNAERMAAETQRARRSGGGVVGFCGRIMGLLWTGELCASGTIFAHQIVEKCVFLGGHEVEGFYFSLVGGCAKVVLFAHRGFWS